MSGFYEMVGRIVVRLVWRRFGTQIKVVGALGVAAVAAAAYLAATRDPPEG